MLTTLSAVTIATLATQCAPNVDRQTVAAIVRTESRGNPLALNVNGARPPSRPRDLPSAIALARRYVALGYSVDLGLGQINSRNMARLGLTWEGAFDPCTNLAALGRILTQNYQSVAGGRHPQTALRMALSLYNTGSRSRGFRNGYVAKVVSNTGTVERVMGAGQSVQSASLDLAGIDTIVAEDGGSRGSVQKLIEPPPPAWNLFERAAYERSGREQSAGYERTTAWPTGMQR